MNLTPEVHLSYLPCHFFQFLLLRMSRIEESDKEDITDEFQKIRNCVGATLVKSALYRLPPATSSVSIKLVLQVHKW